MVCALKFSCQIKLGSDLHELGSLLTHNKFPKEFEVVLSELVEFPDKTKRKPLLQVTVHRCA